jgi:hypothetical protein
VEAQHLQPLGVTLHQPGADLGQGVALIPGRVKALALSLGMRIK